MLARQPVWAQTAHTAIHHCVSRLMTAGAKMASGTSLCVCVSLFSNVGAMRDVACCLAGPYGGVRFMAGCQEHKSA